MKALLTYESMTLWGGVVGYVLAAVIAIFSVVLKKQPERTILGLMVVAFLLHTASLGLRWVRIGHLPVGNIYEALSANVWGMMAAVVLSYWRIPRLRPIAAVVLPVVIMVLGWMLLLPPDDSSLPTTYDTIWLFVHIGFIKIFLGSTLIALGMAGVILLRRAGWRVEAFAKLPNDESLDELAYRFMALGLIFDALGVIAGAIWAKDAWGRYWSWDPLEVWSLITWLSIAAAIHARVTFEPGMATRAALIVAVFVIAFLTFFGVPFVSDVVHKGAV